MSGRPDAVIGWCEWLSLPDLGLLAIPAKVDTGAETSALHATSISVFEKDEEEWVRFTTEPVHETIVSCEAPVHDRIEVVSSSGHAEDRVVIRTRLRLGLTVDADEWPIEVTLANREPMQFPMLLGREAIAGRAVVDPASSYLLGDDIEDPSDFYDVSE